MRQFFHRISGPRAAFLGASVVDLPLGLLLGLLLLALGGGVPGCYDPKVPPGTLHCAALPAKQCPDGLRCVNGLCDGADAGSKGGTGGTGGGGTGGAGGTCATPIAPLCTGTNSSPTTCDPVCQRGCGCGLRCTLTASGAGCVAPAGTRRLGETCNLKDDDCAPGSVCFAEPCGNNLGRCYKFCVVNSDCATVGTLITCGMPVPLPGGGVSGLRICNAGDQMPACDPIGQTGCPMALACYATGAGTQCDCSMNQVEGMSCTFNSDCAPKLTCVTTGGVSLCHRTCTTAADCTGGAACSMISGTYGFCQ